MSDVTEPRRYKLSSEFNADDRAAADRFGAEGKVEREEYRKWRPDMLASERDDLPLRVRLLEEEAKAVRSRSADRQAAALDQLTAADWDARTQAKAQGKDIPVPDGGAAGFDAEAAELEREAQEITQFIAENTEAA